MLEELKKQIKWVVEARKKNNKLLTDKARALAEWDKQNEGLLLELEVAAKDASEAEALLRDLTLKAYAETGNKAPAPGVGIRETTKLDYDSKCALAWAVEHNMALKLDVSAFAKIAKVSPPEFVVVRTEATATISPNLEAG